MSPIAIVALVLGVLPCVPGFLATVGWATASPARISMYHYAWFLSFGISGLAYFALAPRGGARRG